MLKKLIFAIIALSITSTAFAVVWFIQPWQSSPSTHIEIPNFEASGAVFDPYSGQLFLVNDEGSIASSYIDLDSGMATTPYVVPLDGDLEAVATTDDGYIYVGIEGGGKCWLGLCISDKDPKIVELYSSSMARTGRSWKLPALPAKGTSGMEGLTWVPNGAHPYGEKNSGGVFYTSSQRDGKIYIFDVNRTNSLVTPILLNTGFEPLQGQNDISDLYFDPSQKILYVLYDAANRLVQVDVATAPPTIISSVRLPTIPIDQEGVTFLPSCGLGDGTTTIYLTDDRDGRGYYSFNGFHSVCPSEPNKAKIVSQSVPLWMNTDQTYPVSVTVQNTGNTVWTGTAFRLAATMAMSNNGLSVGVSESIYPGQTKTFNFTVTAPSTPGSAYFQWRMRKSGKWFGSPTLETEVQIEGDDPNPPPPVCRLPPCQITL